MTWIQKKGLNLLRRLAASDVSNWDRGHLNVSDGCNELIRAALDSNTPFMAARLGSVEIKPLLYYSVLSKKKPRDLFSLYIRGDIDYVFDKMAYPNHMLDIMCNNAGFFPRDVDMLKRFAFRMEDDIKHIDMLGCWLNEYLLKGYFSETIKFCKLGDLEPYDYNTPWTKSLEGKNVLIIHPFTETITSQYSRREKLWSNPDILPEFSLRTIKAVQSIGHESVCFENWFDALKSMENQMNSIEYDVALIGCGAYGLPLAAHAKRTGHQAIHLGGPLQILFGVKGKRWDNIPSVSKFYNEYWVRPSADETPKNSFSIENGCYW